MTKASRVAEVEEDLRDLLAKCGAALKNAAPQLKQLLDGFGSKAACGISETAKMRKGIPSAASVGCQDRARAAPLRLFGRYLANLQIDLCQDVISPFMR